MKRGFTNPGSLEKSISRHHVVGLTRALLGQVDINTVSLPSSNFMFENIMHETYGNKLRSAIGLELDPLVYEAGQPNKPDWIEYHNTNVFTFICGMQTEVNAIWLDLCSSLSEDVISHIQRVVSSDAIADVCVMSITLQKGREHLPTSHRGTVGAYRRDSFSRRLQQSAFSADRYCKLVDVYEYTSTNRKSAPMSIFSFLITKSS